MNYLRKKLTGLQQQPLPKANHGSAFNTKEKQYYEMEGMLKKLLKDAERYMALLNELCQCKSSIYGHLLYFYCKKSEKRSIIDDLFTYHTHKMQKYIDRLTQEYESNLIGEIRQLLRIFPETKRISTALSAKKKQMSAKKQYYQSLKHPNKTKIVDYSELCEVDEQVRILEHAYQFSIRTIVREFDHKLNNKDSMLDRFCIRMFHSDARLYAHLFKTCRVLRDKSLIFQYYRDYPQGLPSYFRDYSYKEDIQSSSDSDIDAPSANPFYEDISTTQQLLIYTLTTKHGFKLQRVRSVLKQHPNASYEKLLEVLTNVKRPKPTTQPPPPNALQSTPATATTRRTPLIALPQHYVKIQTAQLDCSPRTNDRINPLFFAKPQRYVGIQSAKLALRFTDLQPTKTKPSRRRSRTPPPPKYTHKKKPNPPAKQRVLLKQIRSETKKRLLHTQREFAQTIHFPEEKKQPHEMGESDTETDSEFEREMSPPYLRDIEKSTTALRFSRKHNTALKRNPTRQHRVHSKSFTSFDTEEWNHPRNGRTRTHQKPPPPPRSRTPTGCHRPLPIRTTRRKGIQHEQDSVDADDDGDDDDDDNAIRHIHRATSLNSLHLRKLSDASLGIGRVPFKRKKKLQDPFGRIPMASRDGTNGSDQSMSPELTPSNTAITKEEHDSEDSLNGHKAVRPPITKRDKEDMDALNEDEWTSCPRPPSPHIRSKKPKKKKKGIPKHLMQIANLMKKENRVQPWIWNKRNVGESDQYRYARNGNPLGIGIHTLVNFRYMHQMMHPYQTRHIGEPNSTVVPNKIGINHVVLRNVNIRKLTLNTITFQSNNQNKNQPQRIRFHGTLEAAQQLHTSQQTRNPLYQSAPKPGHKRRTSSQPKPRTPTPRTKPSKPSKPKSNPSHPRTFTHAHPTQPPPRRPRPPTQNQVKSKTRHNTDDL